MDFCRRVFLAIAALIVISLIYGLERLDRFEVVVISIDWLVLMVNGVLLSILFKRQPQSAGGLAARAAHEGTVT